MVLAGDAQLTSLKIRDFFSDRRQCVDYLLAWQAMQQFTHQRQRGTDDELWLLEHEPVFTLGQAGKPEHVLNAGDIPLVKVDRGGQVTYHGPGQLMIYTMIDLSRQKLSVRALIEVLEDVVIAVLNSYDIEASGNRSAPGVYIQGMKIAALGLRISRGFSYHGICFNYHFDASPFSRINPCGFAGMEVTQLNDHTSKLPGRQELVKRFIQEISNRFHYIKTDYSQSCQLDNIFLD